MKKNRIAVGLTTLAVALMVSACGGGNTDQPMGSANAVDSPTPPSVLQAAAAPVSGFVGFGADTLGGLNGTVIKVTNLNNSGAGSLRAALEAKGARLVVFEVAGVIDLNKTELHINNPFLTVAGQTAPSPGITLIRGGVKIRTHDVVMQHIRVRIGDAGAGRGSGYEPDMAAEGADVYNVVVDHCSVSWGVDENLSVSGNRFNGPTGTARKVTLSNNIIAEGLYNSSHSKGIHSMGTLVLDASTDVAVIGNLYAHNNERNPWFKGDTTGVIVNNYVYNPGQWAIRLGYVAGEYAGKPLPAPPKVSIVGNVMQAGLDTPATTAFIGTNTSASDGGRAYMSDNLAYTVAGKAASLTSKGIVSLTAKPSWPTGLQAKPASQVKDDVLAHAGARAKDRDAVDARIISDIKAGKGRFVNSQAEIGGYPTATLRTRALVVPTTGRDVWLRDLATALE